MSDQNSIDIDVSMEECLCKVIILNKQTTCSAVLLVSMCHTHACVNNISLFLMYEMTASISDGTGLPKHAALYITYSIIGFTAGLYENFPYLYNYSSRNGSQNVERFFYVAKKLKLNVFYFFKFHYILCL